MKTKFFALMFFAFFSFNLFCQDSTFIKSNFKGDLANYFGMKLTYPMDLAFSSVSGFADIDFRINSQGKIDSIEVLSVPNIRLADEIVKILVSSVDLWTPTIVNGINVDFTYKLIVEYRIIRSQYETQKESEVLKNKAENKFNKGKYTEALELINSAISHDPYDSKLYNLKSKIYSSLENNEMQTINEEISKKMELQVVGPFVVVAYGIPSN